MVIDPQTGDPERQAGFVVNAATPTRITMRYTGGRYYVTLKETGVELGPFRDVWEARMHADRYEGILERAN